MRKLSLISIFAVVACGGAHALKDQARDAMPSKDSVAMTTPSSSHASQSSGQYDQSQQNSTVGDASPFFSLTVAVGAVFNVPTAAFLDLLRHVTEDFEPTSCTTNSCTWGPGSGALDYNNFKLVVTKNGDAFDWALSGQAKSKPGSDFVTFASGSATPGAQAHHGSGNFTIDFDKLATLDGHPAGDATGQMDVTSYSNVGPAQLGVTFLGAKDGTVPTQKDNIIYSYANDATGGGDLDFALHNTTTGDRFSVHSRWKNDGRGRADVAGLGSGYNVSLSECWSAAPFNVVYFSSNIKVAIPLFGGPDSGAETDCAVSPAAFSSKSAP